ncbi:hypothetical protein [Ralstonia pseudosolanacearum]
MTRSRAHGTLRPWTPQTSPAFSKKNRTKVTLVRFRWEVPNFSRSLAVGLPPVSGVRALLPMPFSGNVNGITFTTRPLLGIKLCFEFFDFFFVNYYHMVRDAMILVG